MGDYTWIQTRDGSPTLWANELGESFRSTKGAFTESWTAFVEPALKRAQATGSDPFVIGEFGLGPGTNWILANLAFRALGRSLRYFVIEKDLSSFELGRQRWAQDGARLAEFLASRDLKIDDLSLPPAPRVYGSLDDARHGEDRAEAWFHDPFGYDVNPDGYSAETFAVCREVWAPAGLGLSYACNRRFQEALASAVPGVEIRVVGTGDPTPGRPALKRERMEFEWRP